MTGAVRPKAPVPLCSTQRPLRIPARVPGVTVEIACEALEVGAIGVWIAARADDTPQGASTHGYVLPAANPFTGQGASPDLAAESAVALANAWLVREGWLDAAPDWEMFAVLRDRVRRMAILAAAGSSIR